MDELYALARDVVEEATRRGITLATAESLTAGMISAAIADVPGASRVLRGGVVSYTLAVKREVLGVTVGEEQVVSAACAAQMAEGARRLLHAELAVSATGIAGPGGGTERVPVGTVCIGIACGNGSWAGEHHFSGNRQAVRHQTVLRALTMILDCMKGGYEHGGKKDH